MIKFVFIITMFGFEAEPQVFVMDHGLTGEDCIRKLSYHALNPYPVRQDSEAVASCEVELPDAD